MKMNSSSSSSIGFSNKTSFVPPELSLINFTSSAVLTRASGSEFVLLALFCSVKSDLPISLESVLNKFWLSFLIRSSFSRCESCLDPCPELGDWVPSCLPTRTPMFPTSSFSASSSSFIFFT